MIYYNTDPALWNISRHHGKTAHIINGSVVIDSAVIARFPDSESAVKVLTSKGWVKTEETGKITTLRAE